MSSNHSVQHKNPLLIYYHSVSDRHLPHFRYIIHMKTSKEIEADLDYLSREHDFISIAEFLSLRDQPDQGGKRKLVLTFDDGYNEVSEIVQPILIRKGIPAAIFLTSGFLDNKELYFRCKLSIIRDELDRNPNSINKLKQSCDKYPELVTHKCDIFKLLRTLKFTDSMLIDTIAADLEIDFREYLSTHNPYLTSEQVQSMMRNGFEIGAHSINHPFYGTISVDEQLTQTIESLADIQHRFNLSYRYFALPHSDSGIAGHFYHQMLDQADIILGGYGAGYFPDYHYYRRFSIEKYGMDTHSSWLFERWKVAWKERLESRHVLSGKGRHQ